MTIETSTIGRKLAVYSGTYATFPTSGAIGDLAYATDRFMLYRFDGATWGIISNYAGSGTYANIPAIATVPSGSLYYATDTAVLYQAQGGAWVIVGGASVNKAMSTTRDMTAASGSVAYTGVGFRPRMIIVLTNTTTTHFGAGFADYNKDSRCQSIAFPAGVITFAGGAEFIYADTGNPLGSYYQLAQVSSFDADGFTLSWTKVGTPAGTLNMNFVCLK